MGGDWRLVGSPIWTINDNAMQHNLEAPDAVGAEFISNPNSSYLQSNRGDVELWKIVKWASADWGENVAMIVFTDLSMPFMRQMRVHWK